MLPRMRLLAAGIFLGAVACSQPKIEPVGTSLPRPLPPSTASAGGDAGLAVPEKVHHECELLIDAFVRAKESDPDRPVRAILDAVFDDPPPMALDRLEWCKKELLRLVDR